jgi:hypothetical protein
MAATNYDIDNLLVTLSGLIGPTIHRKSLNTSPWLKLVKKDVWPDEMGDIISVLTYERSLPTTTQQWNTVTYNNGTGSNCLPAAQLVEFGSTQRTYNLQQSALESPPICVNDLRFSIKRKEQLANIKGVLTENTAYSWIQRFRDEFIRLAEHKVVADASLTEGTASFPLIEPTSILTQGMLDRFYMKLIRDGAGNNPLGVKNGGPEFAIIASPETSEMLIREASQTRDDFHYTNRANELLAPLGVERSYKGFYHLQDAFAPRFDFVGGAWIERPPYVATAATKGNKWVVNSAYESAVYEDTVIFHTDVFTSLAPKPITAPGGDTKFDPHTYMGEFKWLNILNAETNPDGTIGYFRGVFSSGSKPVRPEWGYVIRHQRCDTPLNSQTCSNYQIYGN